MIITNSSPDSFYLKQLMSFLMSVKVNSPKHVVNVFLANYPDEKTEMLKSKFKDFNFYNRKLELLSDGFSFILFRADLIKECFEKHNESVAWIDTDVVVRKDLSDFLEVQPNQIKILYRGDDAPEKVRINAGIFNIGYSNETYDFICDWKKRIESNAKWGMGQLEFWRAYKDHKDKVELIDMGSKFNDLGGLDRPNAFSDSSVMWHCKKAHFNNPVFQKEFKHYLKLSEGL